MKKTSLVTASLALLIILNGCGSQNIPAAEPKIVPTAAPSASEQITPTPEKVSEPAQKPITKTPATTPAKIVPPKPVVVAPQNASISIKNFAFGTPTITIKKGARVTWTNLDSAPHTVTSDSGNFDSGIFAEGKSYSFTFTTTGSFAYHCQVHPMMRGTIIVE